MRTWRTREQKILEREETGRTTPFVRTVRVNVARNVRMRSLRLDYARTGSRIRAPQQKAIVKMVSTGKVYDRAASRRQVNIQCILG